MGRQLLFDREWHYFCARCDAIDPTEGEGDTHLCKMCDGIIDRERAEHLGIAVPEDATDEDVFWLLESHHKVCRYLILVWHESLTRVNNQTLVLPGYVACPWEIRAAQLVPRKAIEQLASELLRDAKLLAEIDQANFALILERSQYRDRENSLIASADEIKVTYWPSVPRDALFVKLQSLLWERWRPYLPFKVTG